MFDSLKTAITLILLIIIAKILDRPIRRLLKEVITSSSIKKFIYCIFIRMAEIKFKGPKRGLEKKAWATKKVKWFVTECEETIDQTIDYVVAALNVKKDSVKDQLQSDIGDAAEKSIKGEDDSSNY